MAWWRLSYLKFKHECTMCSCCGSKRAMWRRRRRRNAIHGNARTRAHTLSRIRCPPTLSIPMSCALHSCVDSTQIAVVRGESTFFQIRDGISSEKPVRCTNEKSIELQKFFPFVFPAENHPKLCHEFRSITGYSLRHIVRTWKSDARNRRMATKRSFASCE